LKCGRLRAGHANLGALPILRRDQQQAFRFCPGAKGLSGGLRLFQRGGTFDLVQYVLRFAIELIAGMAPNDFGRRFE